MRLLGESPPIAGIPLLIDTAILGAAGIERAIIGPIVAGLHTTEEWIELDFLLYLTRILTHTTIDY
jgi:acetylornithine deacetylase